MEKIKDNYCLPHDKLFFKSKFDEIFIGKDESFADQYPLCDTIGNSILVKFSDQKYMFVGNIIYTFNAPENILKYYSLLGNNDVPYPVAVSKNFIFMMLDQIYVNKKYFKSQNYLDAYTEYYGHTGNKMPSKNSIKFSNVKILHAGEED